MFKNHLLMALRNITGNQLYAAINIAGLGIGLSPLISIGSGLIALCIVWVTVGGTATKAASAKPVLALRYE